MSLPDFIIAIPARYASTRFPGKPLALLAGKPMVYHVIERALAAGASAVWVATDDQRIAQAVSRINGVHIALTDSHHASGTDRLAQCAQIANWPNNSIVVNLQGDEPFAPVSGIREVVKMLALSNTPMATLATPINSAEELFDPNVVKVVRDFRDHALYFSRAPIPWHRDAFAYSQQALPPIAPKENPWLRHIGLYAYRADFLRAFTHLSPSTLESIESLEQLRVLEAGFSIAVALSPEPFPPGIDTPEDLERAAQFARIAPVCSA